ncbi:cytochrome c biogenesis protein/redoxin [Enterobacter cloacae]|uniref:cytochrome c biogenesis protein/redoxin n=1 Tax=Enterobacter cloacae complex TaxID=354276 RepID=UPI00100E9465|nr:cytochrome c biogenesis protein/redoxin [Enterobacter cloacae]MCM7395956.1 cytochrome c biogenesis protein/redoxin [Enterobacter cloacae]MDS0060757.1 cytochrome c biogenesis protein/redoxin [Enterobacter cloacae subsp. cloacae]MDS0103750.1 cytochrome c biogenesis protein/redoxin [Enterobacter cloacae subsp. cloacae]MDW8493406.1 cytochrome c biogenesis protein/redoxin [Enterobacter cloacae subsp. cloacae]QGN42904.1 redoxin domain-containing protein [Enterobacter cloacae]
MFLIIAFLGGMISLLSPCTLPVIPLLFAGFQGQRRHILALLAGMIVMFTLVALVATAASNWIAQATIAGRWVALVVLAIAALALIFPTFAQRIAGPAVSAGNLLNTRSGQTRGTLSAFLAGLAVGLLWSPCAGPILGAIFSLNIAGHSAIATGALLAAYGSGCALMLGLLVIGGRALMAPLRARSALMERLRKGAGVVMLATVAFNATGMTSVLKGANGVADRLENSLLTLAKPATAPVKLQPVAMTEPSSQLPSLSGGTGWVNGDPVTSDSLRGKVVLIDFWTWDCINCQHTLPHVRDWAQKYQAQGLVVIGVHTPEYPWEKPLASVQKAVTKWQLPYRVVTDNNYKIWNAFGNQYWPAHYYFDAKGQLRYTSFGEGNYDQQEKVIQQLLKEARS